MEDPELVLSTSGGYSGTNTPTYSSVSCEQIESHYSSKSSMTSLGQSPCQGQSYIIRDPKTFRLLAIQDGELCLVSRDIQSGRDICWQCKENEDRFFGFRNAASGTFIGHDNHGKFVATAREHSDRAGGFFFRRQCPTSGGQVLFVKRQDWFHIWFEPIQIDQNGILVVGREGTAWEFIKIERLV
jgi:hypothetical protein